MPELAEVEFVAEQMRGSVVGAVIERAEVHWPRIVSYPAPDAFADQIAGRQIEAITRRAKILLVMLSDDLVLTVHRRMAGNLELLAAGEPEPPYLRALFWLRDGRRIAYTDSRKFGRLALRTADDLAAALAAFGPEPLAPEFTPVRLAAILRHRRRALKPLLLDQTAIAGLGNIYADEALFAARLHPLRLANTLNDAEIARLHAAIVAVLRAGIAHGGTTFGRHRGFFGEAGTNLDHLQVYQRAGRPCLRCGAPIARVVVAQRGTHVCPRCQPAPLATIPPAVAPATPV